MSVQKGPRVSQSQLGHLQRRCGSRVITRSAAMDQSACPEPPAPVTGQFMDMEHPCSAACRAGTASWAGQNLTWTQGALGSEMHTRALPGTGSPQPTDPTPTSPTDLSAEDKQTQEVIDGSLWKTLITRPRRI